MLERTRACAAWAQACKCTDSLLLVEYASGGALLGHVTWCLGAQDRGLGHAELICWLGNLSGLVVVFDYIG